MVAVCLAPTDLRPEIDDLTGAVRIDARRADLPAQEAAALEHGLRVAEAWDGWVLAVVAGPHETEPVLHRAVALGAVAVRLEWGSHGSHAGAAGAPGAAGTGPVPLPPADLAGDPSGLAAALAAAIRGRANPALVICGDRSAGRGVGAVPALLAHELGIDQALGLVSVSVDGAGRLVAERRLDGGWRERLAVHGPAVLSVEAAGVRLRRASLAAALSPDAAAVTAEAAHAPEGPGAGLRVGAPRPYRPRTRPVAAPQGDAHDRLLALTGALSTREPARVVGPVGPAEAADELVGYLGRSGYTV